MADDRTAMVNWVKKALSAFQNRPLTDAQCSLIDQFLQGKTIENAAKDSGYSVIHAKRVSADIGEAIALEMGESKRINKSSWLPKIRDYLRQQPESDFVDAEGSIAHPSIPNQNFVGRERAIAPSIPDRQALRQLPYCNFLNQNNEFIGRETELKDLLKFISLNYRAPIITVDGIGGVGKTALVLEAAYRCWEAKHGTQTDTSIIFDAIIITSAKADYLFSTGIVPRLQRHNNLQDIFRQIASTLDDPSITQAAPEEQLNRVYQSLGRQKTLLIVDNLEAIADKNEVLAFLSDLPPSTKAVITTRQQVVMYASMRLDCLPEEDSLRLIQQQIIEKGVTLSDDRARQLYKRFGGVPIAIIYAIGQIASGYSLETLLDRSSPLPEDLARFCFEGSVQPLRGQTAHKLLMSLAIFHEAPVWDAVVEVAGLKADPIAVNRGLAQLQQLSLVRQREGRYEMVSLNREYALAEIAGYSDFEKEARERWIKWYLNLAEKHGQFFWQEWHIEYDVIQDEQGNLLDVLHWCANQERYTDVKNLCRNLHYYTNAYGYWEDRLFWMNWLISASERRGDWSTAVYAMSEKAWTLLLIGGQKNLEIAHKILTKAWELRDRADIIVQNNLSEYIAYICIENKKYEEAHIWLNVKEDILNKADLDKREYLPHWMIVPYYQAKIYYKIGDHHRAKLLYLKLFEESQKIDFQRGIIAAQQGLAAIAIVHKELDEAEKLLNTGLPVAERTKHKKRTACYQRLFCFLEESRGNFEKASEWATKALDGFNRLGMTGEAEEMCSLLNSLKSKTIL
ncbi:ATP-binding protein [Microcoleus sp. PH2017_08_TRC_O_A]|uniref:ATP-binding protein n=1 Tax=Microcoleus sp. PH2017_08_TRC_O_A TaxID=2798819 RepID=UPI001D9630D3|nr:ATP-binding protein [Microcoleus sp. PH2017_08_TRC_O_A]MCC3455798.1 ATP-binding protein [Microcoleus sp. PH2017_08_TRC_O_A]TAE69781.1 MAG: ATP-binding protein [Oscillatoriales cyanobacterium]